MGLDLGSVYVANQMAKKMVEEKLYGQPSSKIERPSLFRRLASKVKKQSKGSYDDRRNESNAQS